MGRNECGRSTHSVAAIICRVALVTLVVLTVAPFAPGKDNKNDFKKQASRTYSHTYDEAFQASQNALERMGMNVTAKDKDKGTLSGNGKYVPKGWVASLSFTFDVHVETVNTNPETRVTIYFKKNGSWGMGREEDAFGDDFLSEVQKVLATYH